MSDKSKQGPPDSSSKPPTEGSSTGKTLTELRADYEAALGKSVSDTSPKATIEALQKQVADLTAAEADRTYRKTMDDTIVPAVRGDLKVDGDLVEMWVNKQAASRPELMALWNERSDKPAEFKAAIAALAPEFKAYAEAKGLAKAEPEQSKGKSVVSAVRSARETAPAEKKDFGDVDLSKLSDNQFALHSAEVFRAAREGRLA